MPPLSFLIGKPVFVIKAEGAENAANLCWVTLLWRVDFSQVDLFSGKKKKKKGNKDMTHPESTCHVRWRQNVYVMSGGIWQSWPRLSWCQASSSAWDFSALGCYHPIEHLICALAGNNHALLHAGKYSGEIFTAEYCSWFLRKLQLVLTIMPLSLKQTCLLIQLLRGYSTSSPAIKNPNPPNQARSMCVGKSTRRGYHLPGGG